ncbi:nucleic acid-binding protein [Spirochaetia bacterium]|nr:nucleic acid-binding protein [Spirochaetia bacterium]
MYFLDTNICIYYLKGKYKSVEDHFKFIPRHEMKIPIIAKAELWYGIEKSQLKEKNRIVYNKFIESLEIINLDDESLKQYVRIRLELEKNANIIGSNDLFIASIVLAHDGILVTHNTDEFKRVSGLKIEDWVEENK